MRKCAIFAAALISTSCLAQADTWKPVSEITSAGVGTKMMWIEIRYDSYPDYYTRSLNEADCEKRLLRGVKSEVHSLDGKLVSSSVDKNAAPYYGWVPPITGTPSQEIFEAICGR
jgi:hypothetical protein